MVKKRKNSKKCPPCTLIQRQFLSGYGLWGIRCHLEKKNLRTFPRGFWHASPIFRAPSFIFSPTIIAILQTIHEHIRVLPRDKYRIKREEHYRGYFDKSRNLSIINTDVRDNLIGRDYNYFTSCLLSQPVRSEVFLRAGPAVQRRFPENTTTSQVHRFSAS